MTAPLRVQAGQLLAEARGATSKAAAARVLGCARQTLMGMESGSWSMSLDKLDEVAAAYGVTIELRVTPTVSPVLAALTAPAEASDG